MGTTKRLIEVALAAAAVTVTFCPPLLAETKFTVDPEAGNNVFTAVFDAAIGAGLDRLHHGQQQGTGGLRRQDQDEQLPA